MNIDQYLDLAARNHGLKSDRTISLALGLTPATVNFYRQKKTWPSDDTMVELARLAGIDPCVALADLNIWRSKTPRAREQYQRSRELIAKAGAATVSGNAAPAERRENIGATPIPDLYIMRHMS